MPETDRIAVVAVGGNALIADDAHAGIGDQAKAAEETSRHIADMIEAGWNVVVTHGSGPQVGFILRRSELAIDEVPPVPMDYAAADLQGAIGFMFQRALTNELSARGLNRSAIAVVTQVLVDRNDPALALWRWELRDGVRVRDHSVPGRIDGLRARHVLRHLRCHRR